jgi:hypothetical protein
MICDPSDRREFCAFSAPWQDGPLESISSDAARRSTTMYKVGPLAG